MKLLYLRDKFIYTYEDGRVVRDEYKPVKTNDYITSVLPYEQAISIDFKLTEEEDEDLIVKAEDYVYNEGALNLDKEYKINYFFHKEETRDFYYVEADIVDIENLENYFKKFVKDFKYIDYISFAPTVFEEYYNLVDDVEKGNHIFLYFDERDSFLSFVRDGKFVSSKTLSKFSALKNYMQVDEKLVIEALKEEGIVDLSMALENNIQANYPMIGQFFEEYVTKLIHLMTKTVEYYKLDKIDKIFFYSPFEIKFIEEFFQKKIDIDFELYKLNSDYDPFDVTAIHYNARHLNDEETNFSVFLRPPPFYKTKAGQILLFFIGGLILIGADAAYKLYEINSYQNKIKLYKKIYSKKKKEIKFYQLAIKKYDKKISDLMAKNLVYRRKIDEIYKDLKILDGIDSSPLLFNNLIKLDNLYKKYGLDVMNFDKNGSSYTILVKSKESSGNLIPLFMKDLLKLHFRNVSSKEIAKGDNSYTSEVKFDE